MSFRSNSLVQNNRLTAQGKASTVFVIICTSLVCITVFAAYQFGIFKQTQSRVGQAEFEQTYGKPAGSSPNYKQQELAIQQNRENRFKAQNQIKDLWLTRLSDALQSKKYAEFETGLTELGEANLASESLVQIRMQLVSDAVLRDADLTALTLLKESGARCRIDLIVGQRLLDEALKSDSTRAFETLIAAGCANGNSQQRREMLSYIFSAPEINRRELLMALKFRAELQGKVVLMMLESGQDSEVLNYIAENVIDPNTIIGRDSFLEYSIENDNDLLAAKLLELGASPVSGSTDNPRYALLLALKKRNLSLSQRIVDAQPEALNNPKLVEKAFSQVKRYSDDHEFTLAATKLFFENGVKPTSLVSKGRTLLVDAVRNGNFKQVAYLLQNQIDPNILLNRDTLLSWAQKKTSPYPPEIVTELVRYNALENPLDVIRREKGTDKSAKCDFGQTMSQSIFTAGYQKLEQFNSENSKPAPSTQSQAKMCEQGMVYCQSEGFGIDDCIKSLPTCESVSSGFCCPSAIKEDYIQARCAGLNAPETIRWQQDLWEQLSKSQ